MLISVTKVLPRCYQGVTKVLPCPHSVPQSPLFWSPKLPASGLLGLLEGHEILLGKAKDLRNEKAIVEAVEGP